jgi:hypothetical protein
VWFAICRCYHGVMFRRDGRHYEVVYHQVSRGRLGRGLVRRDCLRVSFLTGDGCGSRSAKSDERRFDLELPE